MANIFQQVGKSLSDYAQASLKEEADIKRQEEALTATHLANQFESEMSQSLAEQEANYDGTYDPFEKNIQTYNQRRDEILSSISNDRIRRQVDYSLSNYQKTYEVDSKVQALKLQKAKQVTLMDEDLSYKKSKIYTNPNNYWEELKAAREASNNWRADLKQEKFPIYESELTSAYFFSAADKIKDNYLKRAPGFETSEKYVAALETLRSQATDAYNFPATSAQREAIIEALDAKMSTGYEALKKTRDALVEADLKAKQDAAKRNEVAPNANGSTLEALNAEAEQVYSDNPAKLIQAYADNEASVVQGQMQEVFSKDNFVNGNRLYQSTVLKQQEYAAAGDIVKANTYEKLADTLKTKLDEAKEKVNENNVDFAMENNRGEIAALTLYAESNAPEGERNEAYQDLFLKIYEAADPLIDNKANIKFLSTNKVDEIRGRLKTFEKSGNIDEFQLLARKLYNDWNVNIGGISVWERNLWQLEIPKKDKQGNPVASSVPGLTYALKYALSDPTKAETILNLERQVDAKGKPTGYPAGITKNDVALAIDKKLKDLNKSFANNFPGLAGESNPVVIYKRMLEKYSERTAEMAPYSGAESATKLVDLLYKDLVEGEYRLIHSNAVNSKIPIPAHNYSKEVGSFIGSRAMIKGLIEDMRQGNSLLGLIDTLEFSGEDYSVFIEGDVKSKIITEKYAEPQITASGEVYQNFSEAPAKNINMFEVDKTGFLTNIKLGVGNRLERLKYQDLLLTGAFLPVGDGSSYRLNARFKDRNLPMPIILGTKEDGSPIYFDIKKQDIENTYYPRYKKLETEAAFKLF